MLVTMTSCSRKDCQRESVAIGLCRSHYNAAKIAEKRAEARAKVRTCAHCGEEFTGRRPNAMYCSDRCKYAATERARATTAADRLAARVCRQCGQPIPTGGGNRALTCSPTCSVTWSNQNRQRLRRGAWEASDPRCLECGTSIASRRVGSVFCTPECKSLNHGRRWRERAPHYMRQHLYGLTEKQYVALRESQGDRCAICGGEWTNGRPHVDHDHASGEVRGLLCGPCNTGLGHFKDDPGLIAAAIKYLTR